MSGDNIFNAFSTAETVWAEIDRLSDAVAGAFAPDLVVEYQRTEEEGSAATRYGFHYEVRRTAPKQRSPGQLLLAFDLSRPETRSSWPHAYAALLTCAYAPRYADGWTLDQVLIGMDGRLAAPEARDSYDLHFGDRLIEWSDPAEEWHQRSWLFSVPLLAVDSHEALTRELVRPVLALLTMKSSLVDPFAGPSAVRFSTSAAA